jgi:hypothetical protein
VSVKCEQTWNECFEDEKKSHRPNLQDDDDGSVRLSKLNFVDFAGTGSTHDTGATGEGQKEDGRIDKGCI